MLREVARDGDHWRGGLERAILDFEERFGGLRYVVRGASLEHGYGIEGDLVISEGIRGLGFEGVFDGEWAAAVLVHADGSTAMTLDGSPYRMIDDSLVQRLEKHARQWVTRMWPHRTWLIDAPFNSSGVSLVDCGLQLVSVASGPADRWWVGTWGGIDCQVELSLVRFSVEGEVWALRAYAMEVAILYDDGMLTALKVGDGLSFSSAVQCEFCDAEMSSAGVCMPEKKRTSRRLKRLLGGHRS